MFWNITSRQAFKLVYRYKMLSIIILIIERCKKSGIDRNKKIRKKLHYLCSKIENQNQYFIDNSDIYNPRPLIFLTYYVTSHKHLILHYNFDYIHNVYIFQIFLKSQLILSNLRTTFKVTQNTLQWLTQPPEHATNLRLGHVFSYTERSWVKVK